VNVTLTWSEVAIGARVGESRCLRNRANGSAHRHGKAAGADWSGDIEAACAEMAAAKGLGVYWPITATPDDDRHGDLGFGIHVRHCARADGRLILHRDDQDVGLFILVTGAVPTFRLCGFLAAAAGKQDEWWCDPTGDDRPAFFVPQDALHPIDGLVALRPVPPPASWSSAYERNA
jgi:hypothetical protein